VRRLYATFLVLLFFLNPLRGSEVFYSLDSQSFTGSKASERVVARMVDELVQAVTRQPTSPEAWRSLVKPNERVAIKVAASGGSSSGTTPAVVQAVVEGLQASGVPAANIVVWDRDSKDLVASGLGRLGEEGQIRLAWIDSKADYDSENPLFLPVLGKLIHGDRDFKTRAEMEISDLIDTRKQLSDESYFPKLMGRVDKIINIPSLTDSFLTGINGALANVTVGLIDNWRRFTKPPMFGNPYVAEIYAYPFIRDKVALTILDALRLQYAGGPFPNPNYVESYQALFASTDPVAIDATAVRLIDEYRLSNQLPSIQPMTNYIETADQLGLGESNEKNIQLIRVGTERFER